MQLICRNRAPDRKKLVQDRKAMLNFAEQRSSRLVSSSISLLQKLSVRIKQLTVFHNVFSTFSHILTINC